MNEEELPQTEAAPRLGTGARVGIGVGIVALLGASIALAYDGGDAQWSDEAPAPVAAPQPAPRPVAAAPAETAPANDVRGVIQSKLEAVISSRVTARITAMPYRVGQSFGKGALLASFDCSQNRAQLRAANAATAAYRKTYDMNVELDAFKAIGTNEVEIAKANLDKAAAEATAISSTLTDCAVHAPFSGRIVEEIAHQHEVAASGQPLMKIQNSADLEVQLIVPSRWLTWLKAGTPFTFKVDETGATLSGRVARLGAAVDPVSKTLRVIGSIGRTGGTVLPGMSGSADFPGAAGANGQQG